jgi:hypothetical protein
MKHGKTPQKLYETMDETPKKIYPYISMPMACLEGKKFQPGEKVRVEVIVEIKHLDENSFSGELLESEIESDEEEKSEKS